MNRTARRSCSHASWLAAAGVFATALALYTATLAPTVTLVDSGELIVAARTLGVAHPPGFPLYVSLAHLATLLPVGSVAQRVNFASALFAALACAVFTLVTCEALRTPAPAARPPQPRRSAAAASRPATDASAVNPITPAVLAALLFACSRTLWAYATIAEVYTLNILLVLLVLLLMLRWRRRLIEPTLSDARRRGPARHDRTHDGSLHAAAFVFGLALGVHHVTVGLTLPALALLVGATAGVGFFKSTRLAWAALCAIAGLSVYAYLPLAASRSPLLNWGDPRSLQRIWWHVGGRQYLVSLSFSLPGMATQAQTFVRLVGREFGPAWLPLGLGLSVGGFAALWRRDRTVFYVLLCIVLFDLAYALNYDIAEDKDAYYLPTFAVAALAAAFGARWLFDFAAARFPGAGARRVAAGALLFVPIVAFAGNLPFDNRRHDFVAADYIDNILSTTAPDGMLLTLDWQVCSPLLYARLIERRRPDVVLIDVNLLRRSWYFDYLRREYPELMAETRDEAEAFLQDLRQWEQRPEAYAHDPVLNHRIDSRFNDLILAFVRHHLRSAPVYVTQDVVLNPEMRGGDLAKAVFATYQLVPQGLVFQLFADRGYHEPVEPRLRTRGLADGTLRFDVDDVVTLKVLPVYVTMAYNRGRYLAMHGRRQQAVEAFQQALALDPGFLPAQRSLSESLRAPAGNP